MGVTGLWTVVHPCARPIKLETLNKRRLAIDASIWIYQFLKAVRDKEGNQLRNSHVVGFFRRICKLLFVGIKPVFVFDGGAPALKRQTISGRKKRREGRREDASRTAGRLLAMQMQRLAEEDARKNDDFVGEEGPLPENVVYVDEITMSPAERQKNRQFRKKDAYHLPDLQVPMSEMGQANDPRVMSLEELQQYADQFNSGEDINVYDFSKIDYESPFFQSLPASDQYNILNAARLRSRLRMGLSKDQLDGMFPDRMAFSKFQIDRVKERNMLTQRLMQLQGMSVDGTLLIGNISRVSGEKGREYVLVKNDGVEGGWALGVVNTTGNAEKPIDVDTLDQAQEEESDEDDEEFEDVTIEGLNRLPKLPTQPTNAAKQLMSVNSHRRRNFYKSRHRATTQRKPKAPRNSNSLFVEQSDEEEETQDDTILPQDDVNLQRAIAMSLEQDHEPEAHDSSKPKEDGLFRKQQKAPETAPFSKGSGMSIARMANAKATNATKKRPAPFGYDSDESESEDSSFKNTTSSSRTRQAHVSESAAIEDDLPKFPGFDGPLPFEKLDLGQSLFSAQKEKVAEPEENAGGFIVDDKEEADGKAKKPKPLPPWFSKTTNNEKSKARAIEIPDKPKDEEDFEFQTDLTAPKSKIPEIIDLEEDDDLDTAVNKVDAMEILDEDVARVEDEASARSLDYKDEIAPFVTASKPQGEEPDESHTQDLEVADEEDDMDWEEVEIAEPQDSGNKVIASTTPAETAHTAESAQQSSTPVISVQDDNLSDEETAKPADQADDEFDYMDPEEEDLFRRIIQEEEEHLRFASSLNKRSLADNVAQYEEELKKLKKQHKSDLRDADEVTQTMITECQQLLSLFGLPYITAPMEAEAQCAELVRLGLVDGIVTDDSDIFLFGGTRVYKNMFNQAKLVECYLTTDLEAEFGLTRQRLISIAQLLGSDYTEGLPGVGPVTALEILTEFGTLEHFKQWWVAVQNGTRTKEDDAMNVVAKKLRRNVTKTTLPSAFPDVRVDEAYLHPEVDSDPSDFIWGVPDLAALRAFLTHTVGWSPARTDEILVPVIRDMNRRADEGTQSNITAFFDGGVGAGAFAPRVRGEGGSTRLHSALQKMGERTDNFTKPGTTITERSIRQARKNDGDEEDESMSDVQPKKKARKSRKKV